MKNLLVSKLLFYFIFLAKQRIPHTTNFEPLLDLLGLLGVNVKSRIQIARNALYTSDKSVQEMVSVIS